MKCPHCGADNSGKFCEYCGSELPYSGPQVQNTYKTENVTHNITNVYYVNSTRADDSSIPVDFPSDRPAQTTEIPQSEYQPTAIISEPKVSPKSKTAALLLCFFLGVLGAHLFYVGRWKKGLLYLFTGGLLAFGWLIDIFVIAANNFKDSEDRPLTGNAKKAWLIILVVFAIYFVAGLLGGSR